ncbi:dUTP diphosphatase [Bacillus salitolerans]|uniref:dUTP diphosphatase n=1 Tax=Bacillus salitolerans TaxID=1437434 RepID=A0ABW4LLF4_9BACI
MNLSTLFTMQKKLDQRIELEHGLQNESLFERKVLALLVELGELANETRCFKFWSKKPASNKDVIVEEYVDGLHFILSLGIEAGYDQEIEKIEIETSMVQNLTTHFIDVYSGIYKFKEDHSKVNYICLIEQYLLLGHALDFKYGDIEKAYMDKNTVNHERQDQGY